MKTQFTRLFSVGAICLASGFLDSGCRKPESAEQKAEQAAIERHERDLQQQRAEWQEIEKLQKQSWEKFPAGPSTKEAAEFVVGKIKNHQLPDTEDASDSIQFNINPFATNYPLSRTFNLWMKSGTFANHYTVVKQSADESWKLQKAWRTDAQGNVVKTYPVDNLN